MDEVKTGVRWTDQASDLPGAGLPGLAHDLKSWLTPVKTCLQLWETGEADKALALRADALHNLNTALDCLEALRQHSPASPPGAWSPVAARLLLRQVMSDCAGLCRQRNLKMILEAETDAALRGDPWLLRRMFDNLLTNALHACPPSAEVRVRVLPPAQASDPVVISVTNPCASEAQDGAEASLRPRLGLRISHEICRLHAGEMDWLCDESARTVSVVIRLPAAAGES